MEDQVRTTTGRLDASGLRVGIVAARFNEAVVDRVPRFVPRPPGKVRV